MSELAQGTSAESVIADMTIDFVFGEVWSRPGLEPKLRSLVTIASLIALRQTDELRNHLQVGLTNGLTGTEIREAIIQTVPYVGFPAAWAAARLFADLENGDSQAP